ncbi:DUF3037 domain-containing protein [Flavobacterium sp. 3HN19-14]|uniref:DUF3037 domain-containing protein n=1 Tax=Flavobacterium sp. 3HN19-14 TaxID=3448133 RepID=UPI003EE0C6A5
MHDKHLYEYAVIRVVPKVEREEFLNVGIILFCKKAKFIKAVYRLNEEKLKCLSADTDITEVLEYIHAFSKICHGEKSCGPIAMMEIPKRFRWLTAVRSSVLQTSRPHPGFTDDLEVTLHKLFDELVA